MSRLENKRNFYKRKVRRKMSKGEIQYRYISPEIRAEKGENGEKHIQGYFSVFNEAYEMFPGFTETIDPHAFDNAISGDIRALWNHNQDIVLGRTTAKTLTLSIDSHGLYGDITINNDDSDAVNAHARVARGDVSQCSFAFDILDEELTQMPDGSWHSNIKAVTLYEVSPCTFPAYQQTSVTARAREIKEKEKKEIEFWKKEMKERLKKWH